MVKELGSGVYLLFGSVYYVCFLSFMFSKCVSISFLVIMSQCFNTQNIQLVEGSLETKVPTIWTDEKHSQEEAEPGRNSDV